MGWWCMATVVVVTWSSGVTAQESYKGTTHLPVSLEVDLLSQSSLGHHTDSQQPQDQSFEANSDTVLNYDYFLQPTPKTGNQIHTRPSQKTTTYKLSHSPLPGDASGNFAESSSKFLRVDRIQTSAHHGNSYNSRDEYTNREPSLYLEEQVLENHDPFSVFYDSMFPDMESVITDESSINADNRPRHPSSSQPQKQAQKTTPSLGKLVPIRLEPLQETDLPGNVLYNNPRTPSTVRVPSLSTPSPETRSGLTDLEKLTMRMSMILEKFGIPKSFTKKIFKEEKKFLKSLMQVEPLREKITKLPAAVSEVNLSHLMSKLSSTGVISKLGLLNVTPKLNLTGVVSELNLTDVISEMNLNDADSILDLAEAAFSLKLDDVISTLNVDQLGFDSLLQPRSNQNSSLSDKHDHFVDFAPVSHLINKLGFNTTYLKGIFNRVGSAAQYSVDSDDGGKLLYLPVLNTDINIVQSAGFILLLLFLIVTAVAYIGLDTASARKDPLRPGAQYLPQPHHATDLSLGNDQRWTAAVDAIEADHQPWEHNLDNPANERHLHPIVPAQPYPPLDLGAPLRSNDRPSHRTGKHPHPTNPHPTQALPHPHITPILTFHKNHHLNSHHPVSHPSASHHPASHHSTSRHPSSQHQPVAQPYQDQAYRRHSRPQPPVQLYQPALYDKHRHFASYEDDYQYEDKDITEDYQYDHHVPNHHPDPEYGGEVAGAHPYQWFLASTVRSIDSDNFYTFYRPPARPTTWRPRRTSTPPSTIITSTVRPTTAATSLLQSRPTSKYALRTKPTLLNYTKMKIGRPRVSQEQPAPS